MSRFFGAKKKPDHFKNKGLSDEAWERIQHDLALENSIKECRRKEEQDFGLAPPSYLDLMEESDIFDEPFQRQKQNLIEEAVEQIYHPEGSNHSSYPHRVNNSDKYCTENSTFYVGRINPINFDLIDFSSQLESTEMFENKSKVSSKESIQGRKSLLNDSLNSEKYSSNSGISEEEFLRIKHKKELKMRKEVRKEVRREIRKEQKIQREFLKNTFAENSNIPEKKNFIMEKDMKKLIIEKNSDFEIKQFLQDFKSNVKQRDRFLKEGEKIKRRGKNKIKSTSNDCIN